jgi:hypothetical protein
VDVELYKIGNSHRFRIICRIWIKAQFWDFRNVWNLYDNKDVRIISLHEIVHYVISHFVKISMKYRFQSFFHDVYTFWNLHFLDLKTVGGRWNNNATMELQILKKHITNPADVAVINAITLPNDRISASEVTVHPNSTTSLRTLIRTRQIVLVNYQSHNVSIKTQNEHILIL